MGGEYQTSYWRDGLKLDPIRSIHLARLGPLSPFTTRLNALPPLKKIFVVWPDDETRALMLTNVFSTECT